MASSSVAKLEYRIQEVGGGDRVACCRHWISQKACSGSLREKCVLLPLRQLCVHCSNQVKVLERLEQVAHKTVLGPDDLPILLQEKFCPSHRNYKKHFQSLTILTFGR